MDIDLQRLKELAQKATTGPWSQGRDDIKDNNKNVFADRDTDISIHSYHIMQATYCGTADDAAYVAAASPDVILAMIQRIEELQAQVLTLKNELERVKE